MTPTPDPALAARLAELTAKTTDEDLHEEGRYFMEYFRDLTHCSHGDSGNFDNRHDGNMIAALWNAYRSGQLITLADHTAAVQAAVAKAVEAEADKADNMATQWGKRRDAAWAKNASEEAHVFDGMALAALTVADAIRSRKGDAL